MPDAWSEIGENSVNKSIDLLLFFADRLKVQLREQGVRHDLVDAVFALGGQDDLLMVVRRVEALGKFLDTDDGKNLLAGTKRANNILAIEEKKDKRKFEGEPNPVLYGLAEEKALANAIDLAKVEGSVAVMNEDFESAMSAMAKLRPAVDAFFDKVKVNDDDPKVRENRLKLLNRNPRRHARGGGFFQDTGLSGLGGLVRSTQHRRHSGMRAAQARNRHSLLGLWIPGSRSRVPRNDESTRATKKKVICLSTPPFKNIPVPFRPKSPAYVLPSRPTEGRLAIVTNAGRDAVDVGCAPDERAACGRRSRVVLTPRRWRQVGERNFTGEGGKQARSPGRARRKP